MFLDLCECDAFCFPLLSLFLLFLPLFSSTRLTNLMLYLCVHNLPPYLNLWASVSHSSVNVFILCFIYAVSLVLV